MLMIPYGSMKPILEMQSINLQNCFLNYETENKIDQELFKKEIENLKFYGYGIKGFVLSMIECALELSNYQISPTTIGKIVNIGKAMLEKPIELLAGS